MQSVIQHQIGTVFVPVSNIEKARDWYARIFGFPTDGEILFGHLYCPPMQGGCGLVLDAKIWRGAPLDGAPLFHFNSPDIEGAFAYLQEMGVELVGEIQHGHFFNFKDLDGNLLMICKC